MNTLKCVVWDLDGTLWPDVALERADDASAQPRLKVLHMIRRLEERGIVNSVASRTDPALDPLRESPELARHFLAAQVGWGDKSAAMRRIAAELGIRTADMALVDDSAFERAEVSAMLPEARVLSVAEIESRIDTPEFLPGSVTDEARRRVQRYREEQARQQAERSVTGSREEFLRGCNITLAVGGSDPADVERIAELVERTHRFNTTGDRWTRNQIARMVEDTEWWVPVARLSDRFGDYGMVGTALVDCCDVRSPSMRLFTVSCRAAGRDVPAALLGWVMSAARDAGASTLAADVRTDLTHTDLRILLRRLGFHAAASIAAAAAPDGCATVVRALDGALPPAVPWLRLIQGATAGHGD